MSPSSREKVEVISFKADKQLATALNALENRSEFIRQALRLSLDHRCPLCAGTGVLDADQQRHLRAFLQHHEIHECERCHALHLDDKADSVADQEPCLKVDRSGTLKKSGRRRTAAALAGLFFLASLATGMHRHEHDDHGDRTETHAPRELCSACVFAASPLLEGEVLAMTPDRVPVGQLCLPGGPSGFRDQLIVPRARAPPCFCA